jgi:anhydro-N-acetylmuramic acid kinase
MKAIGIMSGTSLDGITVSLIESGLDGENFKVLNYKTYPFEESLKDLIRDVSERGTTKDISNLHYKLGKLYAEVVSEFIKDLGIDTSSIEVIGLHGQTIYHEDRVSTLQIGEPSYLAVETHIDVVSNFRAKDIALSGNGAPLIPYFDYLVFKDFAPIVLQNLGGISNLTFVKDKDINNVIAFDIGPSNMLLDGLSKALFDVPYDEDGRLASNGKINDEVLSYLLSHPYLKRNPPKSAGRNEFGDEFLKEILNEFYYSNKINKFDLIATANFFVAYSIYDAYKRFLGEVPPVVVLSGGGSKNRTLVSNLKKLLGNTELKFSDDFGIPSESKEASAFALYALRTKYRKKCGIPTTTGAKDMSIWGCITYGE